MVGGEGGSEKKGVTAGRQGKEKETLGLRLERKSDKEEDTS